MIIDSKSNVADQFSASGQSSRELRSSDSLFARHLKNCFGKPCETEDQLENKRTNKFAGDIASIKEKGLVTYFKELEAKKIEGIRAEILEGMGLTEEDLGNMSPEQRALIEKIVTEEIQRRLIASSLMSNDNGTDPNEPIPEEVMPGTGPDFAVLFMMEEKGKSDPFEAT